MNEPNRDSLLRTLSMIIITGFFGLLLLIGIEFLKYKGFFANNLGVALWKLVAIYLVGLMLVTGVSRTKFIPAITNITSHIRSSWLTKLVVWLLLPLGVFLFLLLSGFEAYNFTNFVFSRFGVNLYALTDLLLLCFFYLVAIASPTHWKKQWPTILFFSFLLLCLFLYNYFFELFYALSANLSLDDDDKAMEQLQVIVLLLGSAISGTLALRAKKKHLLRFIYVAITLFFLLLVAEEISWGERLFNLSIEPSKENYQKELNFHNQPIINEITFFLYIFAFLYATGSWAVFHLAKKRKLVATQSKAWWQLFAFRGNEILFFLPTLIFNPYAARTIFPGHPPMLDFFHNLGLTPEFGKTLNFLAHWGETFEVFFYLGLTIHVGQILLSQYNQEQKTVNLKTK
jgi:hypothetical protein